MTFQLVSTVYQQLEIACDLTLIYYLIFITVLFFHINLCINLLNIFTFFSGFIGQIARDNLLFLVIVVTKTRDSD